MNGSGESFRNIQENYRGLTLLALSTILPQSFNLFFVDYVARNKDTVISEQGTTGKTEPSAWLLPFRLQPMP